MKLRILFVLSFALIALADASQLVSLHVFGQAAILRGDLVNVPEQQRSSLRSEAAALRHRALSWGVAGIVLAVFSAGFLFASHRRREPARRIVVFLLQVFYAIIQSLLMKL